MAPRPRHLFRVYVDESGDRGLSVKSSQFFILAGVLVLDDDEAACRAARDRLCTVLDKPTVAVLHWSENITKHDQRKHAARMLGRCPVTLTYVIVDKDHLRKTGTALTDQAMMYGYAVRRLIERISWYVDSRYGESILTFAHIKRFPYERLDRYLQLLRTSDTNIRWQAFRGKPRIEQQSKIEMLQMADLAAGCLSAAMTHDKYGDVEPGYLDRIQHLIYRRPPGDVRSYGLNVIGNKSCLERYNWWPLKP